MTPEEWQDFQEFQEFLKFRADALQQSRAVADQGSEPESSQSELPTVAAADPALLVAWVTDEIWIEHTSQWTDDAFVCWGQTTTRTAVGRIRMPGPVLFRICTIASDQRSGFGMGLIRKWLNSECRPAMPPAWPK